jgi:hypothetical protein
MNTSTTRPTTRPATAARESVPSSWTAADERFFGIVAEVLPAGLLRGATTLLASYDPEPGRA